MNYSGWAHHIMAWAHSFNVFHRAMRATSRRWCAASTADEEEADAATADAEEDEEVDEEVDEEETEAAMAGDDDGEEAANAGRQGERDRVELR
jgi:hypothetical protein